MRFTEISQESFRSTEQEFCFEIGRRTPEQRRTLNKPINDHRNGIGTIPFGTGCRERKPTADVDCVTVRRW